MIEFDWSIDSTSDEEMMRSEFQLDYIKEYEATTGRSWQESSSHWPIVCVGGADSVSCCFVINVVD